MISVHSNSEQLNWLLGCSEHQIEIVNDSHAWLNSPHSRAAAYEVTAYTDTVKQELEQLVSTGCFVVVLVQELISDQIIKDFDLSNVSFYIPGYLNWTPSFAQVHCYQYFFDSTVRFYQQFPDRARVTPDDPRGFDVLLGRRKHHRDLVFNGVSADQNVVRYFITDEDTDIRKRLDTEFEWPEGLNLPRKDVTQTVDEVRVKGVVVSLSQIIPKQIYSITHSSVVAETQSENSFCFYTEKIAKPLIAGRPFVVASGQYYLRNLKRMGFRTFDAVIDESYDQEPLLEKRIDMLCEQVNLVNSMPVEEWLQQTQEVCDHNRRIILETDWQGRMVENLNRELRSVLLAGN